MSQLLNPQYEIEYHREKMGQLLSPDLMADLYPFSSPRDHVPGEDQVAEPAIAPAQKPAAKLAPPAPPAHVLAASFLLRHASEPPVPASHPRLVSAAPP